MAKLTFKAIYFIIIKWEIDTLGPEAFAVLVLQQTYNIVYILKHEHNRYKFYLLKLPGENLIQTMGEASGTVSLLISSQPEVLYDISSKL